MSYLTNPQESIMHPFEQDERKDVFDQIVDEEFWMVAHIVTWINNKFPQADVSKTMYGSFSAAKAEAGRLAVEKPDRQFFVLKCEGYMISHNNVEWNPSGTNGVVDAFTDTGTPSTHRLDNYHPHK